MTSRSPYGPANSQQANVYGIAPFQRVEIPIINRGVGIDRQNGENFPQLEGDGFIIERADFPVSIAVNSTQTSPAQTIQAFDGKEFYGQFKGLTISHPPFTLGVNASSSLTIIIFKGEKPRTLNSLAYPISRASVPVRIVTTTALALQYRMKVDTFAARMLKGHEILIAATTVTDAYANFNDSTGSLIRTFTFGAYTGLIHGYAGTPTILGANAIVRFPDMPLPTDCLEVVVNIAGTGLGALGNIGGYFV